MPATGLPVRPAAHGASTVVASVSSASFFAFPRLITRSGGKSYNKNLRHPCGASGLKTHPRAKFVSRTSSPVQYVRPPAESNKNFNFHRPDPGDSSREIAVRILAFTNIDTAPAKFACSRTDPPFTDIAAEYSFHGLTGVLAVKPVPRRRPTPIYKCPPGPECDNNFSIILPRPFPAATGLPRRAAARRR